MMHITDRLLNHDTHFIIKKNVYLTCFTMTVTVSFIFITEITK